MALIPEHLCPACGGRLRAKGQPSGLVWLGFPAGFAMRCPTCGTLAVQRVRRPRSAITWPLIGVCFMVVPFLGAAIFTSRSPGFILLALPLAMAGMVAPGIAAQRDLRWVRLSDARPARASGWLVTALGGQLLGSWSSSRWP